MKDVRRLKLIDLLIIIYQLIIFFIFVVIEPSFNEGIKGRTRYVLACIEIGIAVVIFLANKKTTISKKTVFYAMSNILPYFIIFMVMLFRFFLFDDINFNSTVTTVLYWTIPILLMFSAVYLFKEKIIDYTFWAIVINYFLCILMYLYQYKLDGIFKFFYYSEITVTPLEIHELTFSVGLFFIYYAFFEDKEYKGHKLKIALSIICIFLGIKRIEIFALIITYLIFKILNIVKNKKQFMNIISLIMIASCFVYIIIIKMDVLELIAEKFDLEFNSRLEAYNYFDEDYEISLLYEGKGLGYTMDKLSVANKSITRGIGDLHNDILKIYIEMGSIFSFLYFLNFFWLQNNRLNRKFGFKVSKMYFLFTVFTFILYLTDNVNRYLVYILVYTMIPFTEVIKEKDDNKL